MEIRPYVPGDSVRNIMWKTYARNRLLNVRLAEKSVFHSNRTVAYLVAGPNDEAAAAVARVALETGALGENWLFGADGSDRASSETESALVAVAASRSLDGNYRYGLDEFLRKHDSQLTSHCVVFAGAEAGPWVQSLKSTINRFRGQFSLVLATDGFEEPGQSRLWQKLLFQQANGAETGHTVYTTGQSSKIALGQLLTELNQLVESTLVVDRTTGLSFDRSLRKI